jgi:signal transduction histidine kinase
VFIPGMPMNKYKTIKWLARPWLQGLIIFLLLTGICIYTIRSFNDSEFKKANTPLYIFTFIFSLTGGLFAAYAGKTRARLQQSIPEGTIKLQKELAESRKTEIELVKSAEQLRQLINHIENMHEEERLNIVREIHDDLGQLLTVLKMDVSRLGKKVIVADGALATDINELLESINKMVITVRKISSELRPGMLDDIGLGPTLDWYCNDFSKTTGIITSFISEVADDKIPQPFNINMFRIFQGSLNNIVKHSKAKKADVSIIHRGDQLVLLIKDNGKDIDPIIFINNAAMNIRVMEERALMLNGTYNITNTPGKETVIEVSVPLPIAQKRTES